MTPPEPPGSIPSGPAVGEDVLYAPVLERQAEHGLVVCHYGTGGRAVRASAAGLGRRPVFRLPAGTQTIQVRSVGFEEAAQVVELAFRSAEHVTVTLPTAARVLSPVIVSTQRLQAGYARVGFDRRRHEGLGQFFTADDIAKRQAVHFSELLNGSPAIQSGHAPGADNAESDRGMDPCLLYVVDGHPIAHLGESEVDALYRAGQIVGVEIYSGASAPSEFRVPGLTSEQLHGRDVRGAECATVVLWTKAHLLTDQGQ